jgi:hypothetical protein
MTIPAGVTLTIPSGVTVTNNGSIVINGTLANNGTISGGSIVKQQSGTYTPGSGATPQTVDIVVTDFTSLTIAAGIDARHDDNQRHRHNNDKRRRAIL